MAITVTEDEIIPQDRTFSIHGVTDALMYHLIEALDHYTDSMDLDDEEAADEIKAFIKAIGALKEERRLDRKKRRKKKKT